MPKIISTQARVKNLKTTSDVVNGYLFHFNVELVPDPDTEQGTIRIQSGDAYLEAASWDEAPDQEDFATEDAWFNALWEYEFENGEIDIHLMLGELAGALAEPMTILVHEEGVDSWAETWLLNPETKKVERLCL